MEQFAKETLPVSLEAEMRHSYLDYAMSVIVGRALPDVRDGLKPVHRRVLFAMHEANIAWNRPYVKCARVVGDVLGKYHPHGDTATYEALVRMVQDFSLRYPLVDGQGNFGSVDGDSAAAYRYTECRLEKITAEMLADIDKETVDFAPNYDGKEMEPTVLPSRLPNLLVNGSSGIAVGMATNIPPHNLGETIDGCLAVLDKPDVTVDELMDIVPAPDFPTAGIIYGLEGVREGYRTGRGRVVIRARTHIEDLDRGNRQAIVVDEIPYQVNKANLLTRIGELVREKKLEGISDLRDESDKSGMRVVIELKRGEVPDIILNNLFKLTQLQDSFGMNMVALVDGQPRLLNLKQFLDFFLQHRREVVVRRTRYDLAKARERGHILEGLAVALSNVDEIIALIKASPTPAEAKIALLGRMWRSSVVEEMLKRAMADAARPDGLPAEFGWQKTGYRLSDAQAQAILELRLQRLTGLEQDKITGEYREVMDLIADLMDILAKPARVTKIVRDELAGIKDQFADKRRSEIIAQGVDLSLEDLIAPEDMVVTMSHGGYMKSQPVAEYRAQRRGGRGKQATATKEDDFVDRMFIANTHDFILCFSNRGRVYWLKVFNVPRGQRQGRGKPIVNLVPLADNEKITAILPVKDWNHGQFVFMATLMGTVKKTMLSDFSRPRPSGIIAVDLDEGDRLIGVALTDGKHDVMLFSSGGKAVRFDENDVRPMGRNAHGVRGMMLDKGQRVISMLVAEDETQSVLTATENGYGKRTPIVEYTRHGRGTKGMIAIQQSARNGKVVAASLVRPDDEVMLISTGGVLIRTSVKSIREMSRSTQGVTLINLDEGEKLAGLERVVERDDEEEWFMSSKGRPEGELRRSAADDRDAELARHRAAIDALDSEILARMNERAAHAKAIGALKAGTGGAAYRPEREAQVLTRLTTENGGPLPNEAVTGVFREIMSACLALEQRLRVAYLGPAGTFSHAALAKHFGQFVEAVPEATIDDVFRAVESGRTDFAVVPVENSTEGAVGRTLDLMCATELTICGEVNLRVEQNLLSNAGALGKVTRVYSHAQSLSQCVQWLAKHLPAVPRVAVASNAEAARLAGSETGAAAIAGEIAASIYGLSVLAPHIEDEPNNTTRFWVLGRLAVAPSGRDKTSLVMSAPNRPGAVHSLLEPFAKHGVSMSRFESRPARTGLWEYLFFVDLVAHRDDPTVAAALGELATRAPFLKLLGSYPAAQP